MADTTALKNRIRAAIKANDNQEITGPVLQQALLDMVDELNGATETEASQRQNGDSTQNFFELVERRELGFKTWSNNAGITRVETNILGKTESNIVKVDFHINDTNANTLGISFRPSYVTINEGDIVNFAVCFYTDDEAERSYELGIYTYAFDGTFTLLTPKVLSVKKGFNYFFLSIRSNFTQTIGALSPDYQVYFKDNGLDGKTWYAKAYWYIGTPNQKLLIPFDSTLVEDSDNLVKSGDIKRYVDNALEIVDYALENSIFYDFNLNTLQISPAGNHGYTLTKYDNYYSVSYNHVDESSYSVANILIGYAKNFRNGERLYVRYDIRVFNEIHIIKNIPSDWGPPSRIGNGAASTVSIEGGYYIDYSQSVLDAIENLSDDTPIVLAFGVNDGDSSQYSSLDGKTGIFRVSNTIPEKFNYEENKILRVDKVENDVKEVEQRVEDIADNALENCIFYNFNLDTIRISSRGSNRGYTLTKYDNYYSVSYNHVDNAGYSVANILLGYAKDFRNGERLYVRYDIKVFNEIHIIKTIPSDWGPPSRIGNGAASTVSIEGGYYIDYSQSVLDAIENLSDDTPIVLAFGVNDGDSSQYSSLDGKTGIFRVSNTIPEKFNYEENKILRVDKVENDVKEVEQRVEDIEEQIGISKKVVCWGDSLTAGAGAGDTTNAATVKAVIEAKGYTLSASTYNYVTMLQALLGIDYNIINSGVGGENINAISARQGGNLAVFSDIIELPSDTSVVNVSRPISSFDRSSMVNVLLQGDRYVNPCYVQGIPCTLSVTYDAGYTNVQYKLKRNEAGDRTVTLPQYTPIVMQGSKLNPATDIAVLWCWQNGGYSTNEELVEKLKNMISHLHTTKYILIGLHSRSLSSGNVQEALLEKTFGDKFFNWRQYASTNALYDFGITPTTEDITAMGTGSMPPSLLADAVHLNSAGYMILGWKLYERMKNVGYID